MTPTELELIAARDPDAMASFYDGHVGGVRAFCAAVCPSERVEEAVASAMVDFLARASDGPAGTVPDDLLRKAVREAAASRAWPTATARGKAEDPVCVVMPELLAARTNGELPGSDSALVEHLQSCEVCQTAAARLQDAEASFSEWPTTASDPRESWLALAGRAEQAAAPEAPATSAENVVEPAPASAEPQEDAEPPVRVRARRGGLVAAVRQFARSRGTN